MTLEPTATAAKPPVVLMVDDEPDLEQLITQKFRRRIRAGELRFHFAKDGAEAIEKLRAHPDIEVVVTDLNMPRMDGLELLLQIRAHHPLVKAVIVSAYGDLANIRSAMNRGAYDFLTKPLDFGDFEQTVAKTVDHVRALQEQVRALEAGQMLRVLVDEGALYFMLQRSGPASQSEPTPDPTSVKPAPSETER